MSFVKLEGIKGSIGVCSCCNHPHEHLPMNKLIAVGVGFASVTKNGEDIYDETAFKRNGKDLWTVNDAENIAKQNPNNDWRIHLVGPFSTRYYQRQGENLWVLYEKGEGIV